MNVNYDYESLGLGVFGCFTVYLSVIFTNILSFPSLTFKYVLDLLLKNGSDASTRTW